MAYAVDIIIALDYSSFITVRDKSFKAIKLTDNIAKASAVFRLMSDEPEIISFPLVKRNKVLCFQLSLMSEDKQHSMLMIIISNAHAYKDSQVT